MPIWCPSANRRRNSAGVKLRLSGVPSSSNPKTRSLACKLIPATVRIPSAMPSSRNWRNAGSFSSAVHEELRASSLKTTSPPSRATRFTRWSSSFSSCAAAQKWSLNPDATTDLGPIGSPWCRKRAPEGMRATFSTRSSAWASMRCISPPTKPEVARLRLESASMLRSTRLFSSS